MTIDYETQRTLDYLTKLATYVFGDIAQIMQINIPDDEDGMYLVHHFTNPRFPDHTIDVTMSPDGLEFEQKSTHFGIHDHLIFDPDQVMNSDFHRVSIAVDALRRGTFNRGFDFNDGEE